MVVIMMGKHHYYFFQFNLVLKNYLLKCRIFVLLIHTKALLFTLYIILNNILVTHQKQQELLTKKC
eukprot:UN06804